MHVSLTPTGSSFSFPVSLGSTKSFLIILQPSKPYQPPPPQLSNPNSDNHGLAEPALYTLYPLPSTKPYIPPTQHSRVINNLLARHQVRQIQNALQLFRCSEDPEEGRQSEQLCTEMCAPVVAVEPSEAIRAKAHMMLATLGGDGPSAERDRR